MEQQLVVLLGTFGFSWIILCSRNFPTGQVVPRRSPTTHDAPSSFVSVSSIPTITRTIFGVIMSTVALCAPPSMNPSGYSVRMTSGHCGMHAPTPTLAPAMPDHVVLTSSPSTLSAESPWPPTSADTGPKLSSLSPMTTSITTESDSRRTDSMTPPVRRLLTTSHSPGPLATHFSTMRAFPDFSSTIV